MNVFTLFYLQQGYPEKREVRQFQFTAWPDHGVPDHPTPLLLFMRRVKAMTPPDSGPVITHCRSVADICIIISTLEGINDNFLSEIKRSSKYDGTFCVVIIFGNVLRF